MKKILYAFFVLMMAAVSGFAAEKKQFWLECYEDNPSMVDDGADWNFDLFCSVNYGTEMLHGSIPSGKSVVAKENSTDWNFVIEFISNRIVRSSIHLTLLSDLEFSGYDETKGTCKDEYKSYSKTVGHFYFDGKNHSIKNFCQQADHYAGFFKNLDDASIRDVVFENAYIVVDNDNIMGPRSMGAVVADSIDKGSVSHVTVKNSKVVLNSVTNAAISNYVAGIVAHAENVRFENNVLENVELTGTAKDVYEGSSVYVGGLAGYLNFTESSMSAMRNNVAVQISMPYTQNVYAGGLLGHFNISSRESFLVNNHVTPHTSVTAVNADSLNVVKLTAKEMVHVNVGGLVGYATVDQNGAFPKAYGNSVVGGISVNATKVTDNPVAGAISGNPSAVGGAWGLISALRKSVGIFGTSSIGSIKVANLSEANPPLYCGYLVGALYHKEGDTDDEGRIRGNYHYGTADANVVYPAGYVNGEDVSLFSWNHNYRNSVGEMKPNTDLAYATGFLMNNTVDVNASGNPILSDKDMRSRLFAYEIGHYGSSTGLNVFWETDSSNNGLPHVTNIRTLNKIALNIEMLTNSGSAETADSLLGKFTNLKPYYNQDPKSPWYLVLTDRDGKIPVEFVQAYEKDVVKNGYALRLDQVGSVLNASKAYTSAEKDEYVYDVVNDVKIKVFYKLMEREGKVDIPDSSTYVYSPARVDSISYYDDSRLVPRIFKMAGDSYSVLDLDGIKISCEDASGDSLNPSIDNISIENLNFANILHASFEVRPDCKDSADLTLIYREKSSRELRIQVAGNGDSTNIEVSAFGYTGKSKREIERRNQEWEFDGSIAWGSLYKFDIAPGYSASKPMEMDVWYVDVNAHPFDQGPLFKCTNSLNGYRNLSKCADFLDVDFLSFDSAPSYIGRPDEIRNAMDRYSIVRWSVSMDSSGIVSLDSLFAGFFKVAAAKMSSAGIIFVPKPYAKMNRYLISFMLDDTTGVVSSKMRFNDKVYVWGDTLEYCADRQRGCESELVRDLYRNDGCAVGWKSGDMKLNDSTLKFGLNEFFNVTLAEEALTPGFSTLYPIWAPAGVCAEEKLSSQDSAKWTGAHVEGTFTRTVIDAVGADIQIIDKLVYPGESEDSTIRNVGYSKSLLLPTVYNGPDYYRILKFSAKDGFEAPDSMTFYYDLSRKPANVDFSNDLAVNTFPFTEKIMKFANGDTLPNNLYYSVLEGEFTMVNTTPLAFVDSVIKPWGSAVLLDLSTTEFAAGRGAVLNVSLMDNLGNMLDINDSLKNIAIDATPYSLNTVIYPLAPGQYTLKVDLRDLLDSSVTITKTFGVSDSIRAGKDRWMMVSLDAVELKDVGKDDDQIFYWWNDSAEVGEFWHYLQFIPSDKVTPTRGYWYSSLEGRSLKLKSSYADTVNKVVWTMDSVYSGWNMVSNPHGWAIAVPDSLDAYRWNIDEADYEGDVRRVDPYEAIWVHVNGPEKVVLDGTPVFPSEEAKAGKKRLAKAKSAENWTIRAVLADNRGRMDSWNVLGVGEALEGYEPPSGMGDQVNFTIKAGKKYLAKSVKAAPASSKDSLDFEWDVVLSASSDRKGKLFFEGLEDITGFGYHLYVTMDGKTTEVLAGDTLQVGLKASGSTAKVRVTKEKLYLVTAVNGLRMAQAGNRLNVGFTATENLAGARMVVDVLDMDGKVKSTYSARAVAGSNTVSLDAPKSGLYMLRVRVASQQAAGKILVK